MDRLPRGLTRKSNGIRIRVNHKGRRAFDKTILGNPYSPTLIAQARALANDVRERLSLGLPLEEAERRSFPEACQSFLNAFDGDPDVRTAYKRILQRVWMPRFHEKAPNQITDLEIEDTLRSLNVKIKTQKNYLSPLRQVLDREKVSPNPAQQIRWNEKQRKKEKHEYYRYDTQEQANIIAALDWLHEEAVKDRAEHPMRRFRTTWTEQARAFYPMLFAIGLRPGEALALRWDDYDGERVFVHATHSQGKRKEHTKTGERRRVYVPEWVRPRIDALPSRFSGGAMFLGHQGKPLVKKVNLNAIWRDALKAVGLPEQDPYVCRHSRAAELLSMRKASIAECAAQMGHTETVFMSTYAEEIEEFRPREDFSKYEREVAPSLPQWKPGEVIKLRNSNS